MTSDAGIEPVSLTSRALSQGLPEYNAECVATSGSVPCSIRRPGEACMTGTRRTVKR